MAQWPPSSYVSDIFLHIKYAEKTDDYGIGFSVEVNVSGWG